MNRLNNMQMKMMMAMLIMIFVPVVISLKTSQDLANELSSRTGFLDIWLDVVASVVVVVEEKAAGVVWLSLGIMSLTKRDFSVNE